MKKWCHSFYGYKQSFAIFIRKYETQFQFQPFIVSLWWITTFLSEIISLLQWKVAPKSFNLLATSNFSPKRSIGVPATVWDALAFKHQAKKWQKSISPKCGFGRFPKVPELLWGGQNKLWWCPSIRLWVNDRSQKLQLTLWLHAYPPQTPGPKIYSRPRSLRFCAVEFNCGFTLCGRTRISCRWFIHSCGCLFYAFCCAGEFFSTEVRAAIKLTNFSMLLRTRPRVF